MQNLLIYIFIIAICGIPIFSAQRKKNLFVSLLMLCFCFSIREGQGDYYKYYELFLDCGNLDIVEIIKDLTISTYYSPSRLRFEIGYTFLNILFYPIGFKFLVFFITALFFVSVYFFIISFIPRKYYIFSYLLLVNPTLLIVFMSAQRQAISASLLLCCLIFYKRNVPLLPFLILMIIPLFHRSGLIFLIIPFICVLKRNITFLSMVFIAFIFLFFVFFDYVILLLQSNEYILHVGLGSNVLYSIIICLVSFLALRSIGINHKTTFYTGLFLIFLIFFRLCGITPKLYLANRFGMYSNLVSIAYFPYIFSKKNIYSRLCIMLLILLNIIQLIHFFYNPTYIGQQDFNYLTIFSRDSIFR